MGRTELERDLSIIFSLMQSVALWPYEYDTLLPAWLRGRYRISSILNVLYFIFWQFICLHIAVFHIKTVLDSLDNFNDLFLVMVSAIIYCLMLLINLYFQLYYRKNVELIKILKEMFKQRSAAGLTYIKFESSRRHFIRLFKIWIVTCVLGTLHWAIFPILQQEKVLPLQCWYPFDVRHSPMYELAFFGQVLGQLQVGIVYGMTGALLMMYIFTVCGQFDILCCSLNNVYYTAMINRGGNRFTLAALQADQEKILREPSHYYINEVFLEELGQAPKTATKAFAPLPIKHQYLEKLQDDLVTALDACIDHHAMLLNFCHQLEECYHPFVMLKLGQMLSLLCVLSYMATVVFNPFQQDSLSAMKLMNIMEYFVLTMTELFLFCYLGQTLINQSSKVGDALMTTPWYEGGATFRRRVVFILMASQKALKLTAFKMYRLDFETYFTVLKTAFSYYTLLKKLQSGHRRFVD
ncbi:odorant receptor 83a [Ochlerotatus camptorhynchus]|uniref:odorant receptor 83a n=1 Tax=Ochlerotatus camptorhynchus TaxID=644619 RepID=UPI0031D62622